MGVGKTYSPARPGQPLRARDVNNNIVRAPMRGQTVSGGGNSKRLFPDGVAVDLPDSGSVAGASNYIKWAEVQSVGEDTLTVKVYNPVTNTVTGESFDVAKPYLLQQSTFDGVTVAYIDGESITYTKDATDPEYKRNHDNGVTNADFIVTPNWFVGEQVIIKRVPTYVNGTLYNWIEDAPGRYWAEVP